MRRLLLVLLAVLVLTAAPGTATTGPRIEASANTRLLASVPFRWGADFTAWSMAADGDHLFVGSAGSSRGASTSVEHGGFIAYRLTAGAPYARQISTFVCPSSQEGGLTVWDGLLVQSVDPADVLSNPEALAGSACTSPAPLGSGGLRVVDVRDAARPRQVDFEPLVCGVRNHALVPSGRAAYLYAVKEACPESAASTDLGSTRLRVVKLQRNAHGVDIRPAAQIQLPAGVECHGWSVLVPAKRAVCYGRSRLVLFDVADPANPALLGMATVPGETFYGAGLTPDGRRLVTASTTGVDACTGSEDAVGVVRTFDVRELAAAGSASPSVLTARSTFSIPRAMSPGQPGGQFCSSLSVTVIPGRAGKAFAAVGWNTGGMTVLDVTGPRPREVAHFATKFDAPPDVRGLSVASGIRRAIWYRGRVYAPELMDRLGLRVLEVKGLGLHDVAPLPQPYNPQTQGG